MQSCCGSWDVKWIAVSLITQPQHAPPQPIYDTNKTKSAPASPPPAIDPEDPVLQAVSQGRQAVERVGATARAGVDTAMTTVKEPFIAAANTLQIVQKERVPAMLDSVETTVTSPPFMGAAAGAAVALPVTRRLPGVLRALLVPTAAAITGTLAYMAAYGKLPHVPAEIPSPSFAALEMPAWLGTATGAKSSGGQTNNSKGEQSKEIDVDLGQSQPTDMDTYPSRRSGDGGSRTE